MLGVLVGVEYVLSGLEPDGVEYVLSGLEPDGVE
jgi:hypothetical protein